MIMCTKRYIPSEVWLIGVVEREIGVASEWMLRAPRQVAVHDGKSLRDVSVAILEGLAAKPFHLLIAGQD